MDIEVINQIIFNFLDFTDQIVFRQINKLCYRNDISNICNIDKFLTS